MKEEENEAIEMFEFCSRYNCVLDEKKTEIISNLIKQLQKEKEERNKYILKSKIKKIIYPTPENPISIEIQSSEMYRKIEKLLEDNYEKF